MIAIISFIFNRVIESAIFLSVFAILRTFCGGYHANTHLTCALILVVNYLLFMLFLSIQQNNLFVAISGFVACFASLIICFLSPIENKNKPMTKEKKKKNRKTSQIITVIVALLLILTGFFPNKIFSLSIAFSLITVSISQLSTIVHQIVISKRICSEVSK